MTRKFTVSLRRFQDREVVGEVLDEDGQIVHTHHFGEQTDEELELLVKAIRRELPRANVMNIAPPSS